MQESNMLTERTHERMRCLPGLLYLKDSSCLKGMMFAVTIHGYMKKHVFFFLGVSSQAFWDDTSSEVYYGNLSTNETSWDRP